MEGKEHYRYTAKELREISNIHASDTYKVEEALDIILSKCLAEANNGGKCICISIDQEKEDKMQNKIYFLCTKYRKEITNSLKSLGYKLSFTTSKYYKNIEYLYIEW